MPTLTPFIPETVTVHLGPPDTPAANVTVSFPDYIKNVASSEIYPTWPESAIRANIYAQISFALNRIYTEYYRSRGYDFDITNSTTIDQSFVNGRDVFENISQIVDEIFNSYIRRRGSVEPLFAAYCDGEILTCPGLSQWGTVALAEQGYTPYQILAYYYGDDIDIVRNVPVEGFVTSAPAVPLRLGSVSNDVLLAQIRLNRIATNYPAIPKIYPVNGVFGQQTEDTVRAFQRTFNLTPDGIIGNATWYRIQYIYNGVKRLNELESEGLTIEEIPSVFPESLSLGSSGAGVLAVQYYLSYVAQFLNTVPAVGIDGSFGPSTDAAVRAFQRTYGLDVTGVVDEVTWDVLYDVYLGMVASIPLVYREGVTVPFGGIVLQEGSTGEAVTLLQEYLNYIGQTYTEIPRVTVDGVYGPGTAAAVEAFQRLFGISVITYGTTGSLTWKAITDVYEDLYRGNLASSGQNPGYTIS